MSHKVVLSVLLIFITHALCAQITAHEIIDKSIAFHDPYDNWHSFCHRLSFSTIFPGKEDSKRIVDIDNKNQTFSFWAQYEEGLLNYIVEKNKGSAKWNAATEIPAEAKEKYKISAERAIMYKDYYSYLYGMPMKIKDPGSIIDPRVAAVRFYDKDYYRVCVTYSPEVGKDIWYFYFDKSTYALEAYQFYHDEEKNDGEYILFEELKEIDGIKIPRIRHWYYNKDEKFLATDILE